MNARIFGTLLRLYPARFRNRYGTELMDFFRADLGEARGTGARRDIVIFWMRTVGDLVKAATRMRLRGGLRNDRNLGGPGPSGRRRKLAARRTLLESLWQDLRFATRMLRKRRTFAAVAVSVIGLGIGASTTLFSAVDGVLLRSLPYPEADRLAFLGSKYLKCLEKISPATTVIP